jgi:predicted nucleotidyltransferase
MKDFLLDDHKDALAQYFASLNEVVLAYLFGSHARGQAWAHSDIDVAVLLAGHPNDTRCLDLRLEVIGGLMDTTAIVDRLVRIRKCLRVLHALQPMTYEEFTDSYLYTDTARTLLPR